jgi:hypothetical protein
MRIIQISGKGRVGKTTLAHLIARHSFNKGYIPVILPFAQAIKVAAEQEGITKEADSSKYRKFCQTLGATRRAEDPDYWVVKTFEVIQEYMVKEIDNKKQGKTNFEYVIIQDDVRYMNELAFGRDLVATQIFLEAGERTLEEANAEWRHHESETLANSIESSLQQPNNEYEELFDFILTNDGSLQDLEHATKDSLELWLNLGYLELEDIDDTAD